MKLTMYQIDAFSDKLFGGNPAAVIPLKKWLPDELMQQLGMENNLAETVFFVPSAAKGGSHPLLKLTYVVMLHWHLPIRSSIS